MDEFGLKTMLGDELYDEGRKVYGKGNIRLVSRPLDELFVYDVDDATVITRTYGGDRDPLYDCNCSTGLCKHIAALAIFVNAAIADEVVDDSKDIEYIEDLIADLYGNITSDSGYNEEENYLDDWELDKYDIESENYHVEYDYVSDVCKEIRKRIRNPLNMANLFADLFKSVSKFEYDNDGAGDALSECRNDILRAYSCIPGEDLARILSDSPYDADDVLEHLKSEVIERAYRHLGKFKVTGNFARDVLFDHGDYDAYLDGMYNSGDLIRVLDVLIENMDYDEGRRLFGKYSPEFKGSYDQSILQKYAEKLSLDEVNSDYCYDLYLENPNEEYYSGTLGTGGGRSEADLIDYARRMFDSEETPNYRLLTFLAGHDRAFVSASIRKDGFVSESPWGRYRNLTSAKQLFRSLVENEMFVEAAIIGRGIVEARLDDKNSKMYEDGVEILKEMGRNPAFESVSPPHSEYLASLKDKHRRTIKFWGLYKGTW